MAQSGVSLGVPCLADSLADAASGGNGIRFRRENGSERCASYADVLAEAEAVLGGLRARSVRPGDAICLQVSDPESFLPLLWGCLLGGVTPLVISPRRRVPKLASRPQPLMVVREVGELAGGRLDAGWSPGAGDDPALLMLTSGTTGTEKVVVLTHRNILTSVGGSAHVNGYTSADVSLNWLPLCHIGGLMRAIRETHIGAVQVQVSTEAVRRDPLHWIDLLDEYAATLTWAPASAFAAVVDRASELPSRRRWRLDSLRSVYASGEMVAPRMMRAFADMFAPYGLSPSAMHVAWGMTEACFATYSHDFLSRSTDFADCGEPVPGLSLRIVDEEGEPLSEGECGELEISGPLVSRLAADGERAGEWVRTGDLGTIREGRLTITGRVKDIIKIGGLTFSNHEIEQAAGGRDGERLAVACTVPEGDREELAVFVTSADPAPRDLAHRVRADLIASCGIAPRFVVPIGEGDVPRSDVGKLQRLRLRESFVKGHFELWRRWPWDLRGAATAITSPLTSEEAGVAEAIASVMSEVLGIVVGIDDDFFAQGGSSLRVVQATAMLNDLSAGRRCAVGDLFHAPTARMLAMRLLRDRADESVESGRQRLTARASREGRSRRRRVKL